jgi:hypothetical protein
VLPVVGLSPFTTSARRISHMANRRDRSPVPFTSKGLTSDRYHRLGIRIPVDLAHQLRAQAEHEQRSVTTVVRLALRDRINGTRDAG